MKKIICLTLSLMLLLTMAVSAAAQEGEASQPTGESTAPAESSTPTETTHTHSWSETITTKATCTQEGSILKTCVCGQTQTEAIPRLTDTGVHNWAPAVVIKAATCKEEGTQQRTCTVCGEKEVRTTEKLTTHSYGSACDGDCDVCGATRTVSHSFTTAWSSDYKGHWHECTKCGKKADEEAHNPGPDATEDREQICQVCNYVIAEKKPHTHSYGTEWTSDSVGHWHACTNCTEERDYASHRYDDDCDGDCNVCGYKRANSHTYDKEGWMTSGLYHWNVCSVCGEESQREKHVPGPEATDKDPQMCSVCGYELAPIQEHTHDFGQLWHQDDATHWQECSCGELSVPAAHVWDAGRENRNDTITYSCTLCGAEKTEAAPGGFPWMILLLSILAVGCLGGIGVLVYLLKTGAFAGADREAEEEESWEEDQQDWEEEAEEPSQEDQEEKMIDDYFASLDGGRK